jgi:hypothetical protein
VITKIECLFSQIYMLLLNNNAGRIYKLVISFTYVYRSIYTMY